MRHHFNEVTSNILKRKSPDSKDVRRKKVKKKDEDVIFVPNNLKFDHDDRVLKVEDFMATEG